MYTGGDIRKLYDKEGNGKSYGGVEEVYKAIGKPGNYVQTVIVLAGWQEIIRIAMSGAAARTGRWK